MSFGITPDGTPCAGGIGLTGGVAGACRSNGEGAGIGCGAGAIGGALGLGAGAGIGCGVGAAIVLLAAFGTSSKPPP